MVVSIWGFVVYESLAIYQGTIEKTNVASIVSGDVTFTVTSDDTDYNASTGQITVASNTEKYLTLTVTNTTPIKARYQLYYKPVSPTTLPSGVSVRISNYTKNSATNTLDINGTANIRVSIYNTSTQSVTIKLGIEGGYSHNSTVAVGNGDTKVSSTFTENETLYSKILGSNKSNVKTTSPTWTNTHTDKGLYVQQNDTSKSIDGKPTYYYRGNVDNNYLKFPLYIVGYGSVGYPSGYATSSYNAAVEDCERYYEMDYGYVSADECINDIIENEILWRIVRIQEDGSIRLIGENGINDNTQYLYSKDNENSEITDYTFTNSNAYTQLNKWYNDKIHPYNKFIKQNTIFCNDTSLTMTYDSEDTNKYSNIRKTFVCPVNTFNNKIALITADEVLYSGLIFNSSTQVSSYLSNSLPSYTMSTVKTTYEDTFYNDIFFYHKIITDDYLNCSSILRPVINLKTDVKVSGTGTSSDPYIIIGTGD